ncbi:putative porin [Acinetobacter pseudolwoffii]|uniref:putative porin n=1 Tax=Acinetobacter pseudolwoffii TaxID=2053287 RepID=UPI000C247D33|nr:putative porin [Acinetobacter pseudolwoffii]PJI34853.1 putative porin [Acinetobacter pseudolwoffii]
MLKKLALATALLAGLGTAHAYQTEVGASIDLIDRDQGGSDVGFAIDGTYYFNSVQVKNSPLNEAAFLNRASNVNGVLSYQDDSDTFGIGAGIEYFVPNSDFYLSGNITHFDNDAGDITGYAAEAGYLPVPGLLVALGLVGISKDNADDEIDPTLRAKYVTQVGQYDMNFEGGASFGDIDAYNLGADLYLDKTFSVGLGFSDSDLEGKDVFTIRAKKFFNQQVSLEGSIDFGDNTDIFGVRGAYRF